MVLLLLQASVSAQWPIQAGGQHLYAVELGQGKPSLWPLLCGIAI